MSFNVLYPQLLPISVLHIPCDDSTYSMLWPVHQYVASLQTSVTDRSLPIQDIAIVPETMAYNVHIELKVEPPQQPNPINVADGGSAVWAGSVAVLAEVVEIDRWWVHLYEERVFGATTLISLLSLYSNHLPTGHGTNVHSPSVLLYLLYFKWCKLPSLIFFLGRFSVEQVQCWRYRHVLDSIARLFCYPEHTRSVQSGYSTLIHALYLWRFRHDKCIMFGCEVLM